MTEFTWENLVALFPEGHTHNNGSVKNDLLWWAAYDQALEMCSNNTAKDWAHVLLDGYPSMEVEDVVQYANSKVENWLDENEGDENCDEDEAKRQILNEIREFYKLPLDK